MSRDFTKNVANYMNLPNGDASALNGASITGFSMWAILDTITAGSTSNYFFALPNTGSGSDAFVANLNASALLRIRGRANSTETVRTASHSTPAITTGTWFHIGGQIDWANDLIYTVVNGVQESHSTTGWTATTFTCGNGTGQFRIGQASDNGGGAPGTANAATDGRLAHVAFWRDTLLTAADWEALGAGVLPWKVRPAGLVLYRDFACLPDATTDVDLITHGSATIGGSLPLGASEAPTQLWNDAVIPFDPSWMEPSLTTIAPQAWGNLIRQMAS